MGKEDRVTSGSRELITPRKSIKALAIVAILFLAITPAFADPLDNWHWRNPLPQGNPLQAVAYGSNTFVAVGNGGTILTSPDGVTWTSGTSGTGNSLNGICYSNNIFVAVGTEGTILTSPDGLNWTPRTSGTDYELLGITHGNGTFVAVGKSPFSQTDNIILTSVDGVDWIPRTSGSDKPLYGIVYGNGIFIAVGISGGILTSPDGITWVPRTSGTAGLLHGVSYGNGIFTAVGSGGKILTSDNGMTWTPRTSGTTNSLNGICYGNNAFVAVGRGTIITSADGITWAPRTLGTANLLNGIGYGNSAFVALGEAGTTLTSTDGGETWIPGTSGTSKGLWGITFGDDIFVAVGDSGTILTSSGGGTWTPRTSGTSSDLGGIAFGNGKFVAVGMGGTILTSAGGETWTPRTSGTDSDLWGISYGNGTFVAVGDAILTSSDGIIWMSGESDDFGGLNGITYGETTFVAVGDGVHTSSDGLTWTPGTPSNPDYLGGLYGIGYGGWTFVAVGEQGTILTSADGMIWVLRDSVTTNSLRGTSYGNDTFVAVGEQGTILQSGPLVVTSCNVTTNPPALQISVDGSVYASPQAFNWLVESSHTLSAASPQNGAPGTQYIFSSWNDGLAQTHAVITPSSSTTYTANFGTRYRLVTSANPAEGGTVAPSGTNWYDSGQSVSISATPNPGFTFSGWSGTLTGTTNPAPVVMTGPQDAMANFCPILTAPSGPSPSDGTGEVPADSTLTWSAPSRVDSYDIYLGTTNPPPIKIATTTAASYSPSSLLSFGTTYYWQVVARNNCGNSAAGPVWSFVTPSLGIAPKEGTVGTVVTITAGGFGTLKGKVRIGNVALKVLSWGNGQIQASLSKALAPGTYGIMVQPKAKGSQPITQPNLFEVKGPEIDPEILDSALPGQMITINGKFFGSKKGKVMIGGKACAVKSWTMDPWNGASTVKLIVPKTLVTGSYDLKVINATGEDTIGFTIN